MQFVNVPLAGVPNAGVTKVGLVANTNEPLPVSSDIAVFILMMFLLMYYLLSLLICL